MKTLKLNAKTNIPILGFGTWQLSGQECQRAVEKALEVGYRHIDTADAYGNHVEVATAIQNSGVSRNDLFITTKIWRDSLDHDSVLKAGKRFLDELQTDYIDLLLIHWPNRDVPINETLKAMNQLKTEGKIKAVGVSNFTIHHLEDALKTKLEFSNNQVELHPSFSQPDLVKFCQDHGIVATAYSPIGRGQDLKIHEIQDLAKKHDATPSQIILSWLIHKNIVAIPRSSKPAHIEENFKSLEIELSAHDLKLIDELDTSDRTVIPGFADFDY